MALPTVLLKAKSAIKKGAAVYNAGKQAKNTDGEEAISSLFNKIKLPLMIGGGIFVLAVFLLIVVVATPFIFASEAFGKDSNNNLVVDNSYLQWAIDIANDDSHGYSQCNRTGPDYDCSSLVWYALVEGAGFDPGTLGSYPFSTHGEASILKNAGFKEYTYTGHASLQPGDILLRNGHTGIYVGDDQTVEAHMAENGGICGTAGDQTGHEIDVSVSNSNWETFYRLE